MAPNIGILLVGHGTASPLGTAEFAAVAHRLRPLVPAHPLAFGFLELARPTIDDAAEVLAQQGVKSLVIAPLLLFAAGHAKQDIPQAVRRAAERRGLAVAGQADVLGRCPRIVELVLKRYRTAAAGAAPGAAMILVGRGSRDAEAQAETAALLADCQRAGGLPLAAHGFLAMAEPRLPAILDAIGAAAPPTAVVVPHLLFHGQLVEKCSQWVADAAARYPQTAWKLAGRLGPDEAVILSAFDRLQCTLASLPAEIGRP